MKIRMRKGFTLVELLIVIVIIGILAVAMMLSSGSATDSARAAVIITNMRSLKAAVMMYWVDSMDSGATEQQMLDAMNGTGNLEGLAPYLDNPNQFANKGYTIVREDTSEEVEDKKWFVKYDMESHETEGVMRKLAGRAQSVGLLSAANRSAETFRKVNRNVEAFMLAR